MFERVLRSRFTQAAGAIGIAAILLAGCGGGGGAAGSGMGPGVLSPGVGMGANAGPANPAYNVNNYDDWATMGHDFSRTGYQAQNTGTSKTNVKTLGMSWRYTLPSIQGGIIASPLVYHGYVIVVSRGIPGDPTHPGTVYALKTATGQFLWMRPLGGEVRGTPTIADGNVFVGDRLFSADTTVIYPSYIYSINLATGALNWRTQILGASRSSPLVTGGVVYTGVSGGDPPQCLQGGLIALNEATGAKLWYYAVDPASGDGGSVWSPISLVNGLIVFGTGNTCHVASPTGNAVVALDSSGTQHYVYLPRLGTDNSQNRDDDQAGGILSSAGNLFFINKNGSYYGLNSSWTPLFNKPLGAAEEYGMFSTPSTDGTTYVVGAGQLNATTGAQALFRPGVRAAFPGITDANGRVPAASLPQGKIVAFDMMGDQKWSVTMNAPLYGQVAINNGVVYAGMDDNLEALDSSTGAVLWKFAGTSYFAPSPAIVPSGLFAADAAGHVYRFHHVPW